MQAVFIDTHNGGTFVPLCSDQQEALLGFINGGKVDYTYNKNSIQFTIKKTKDFPDAHVYQLHREDGRMAWIAESKQDFSRYTLWRRMDS